MRGTVTGFSKLAAVILLFMVALTQGQVVHENPEAAVPSRSQPLDGQLTALMENMMLSLDDVSKAVEGGNFTAARASYSTFYSSFTKYNDLLWQLNLSGQDYRSIADQMNFTSDQVRALIDEAEAYDRYSTQYDLAVSAGDTANATSYAAGARDSYANVSSSYDGLKRNSTLLGQVLTEEGLDTGHLDSSMDSLDRLMARYNSTYENLSVATSGPALSLSVDRSNLSVGDEALFRVALKDANGTPMGDKDVTVYVDGKPAGLMATDSGGEGSVRYAMPVNLSGDHVLAHAEYVPSSGPIVVSNYVDLYLYDLPSTVSAGLSLSGASYGVNVSVAGVLSAGGQPMPFRPVEISFDGSTISEVRTDENGSYTYELQVGPYTPAGIYAIKASYNRTPGDLLLSSSSPDIMLSIYARATDLTMDAPGPLTAGSVAGFTGTLATNYDLPVAGADVTVYIDGEAAGVGTTDTDGSYRVLAAIPQNASAGGHYVYASFSPGAGKALMESSTSPIVVQFLEGEGQAGGIPFEWAFVAGAVILSIVAASAMLYYRRYAISKPGKAVVVAETPAATIPIEPPIPEKVTFNAEEEAAMIRSIAGHNTKEAATRTYLAWRKLLTLAGLKLEDSMTHNEVYRAAEARFPDAIKPLRRVIGLYEKAVFAGKQPLAWEIEEAAEDLKEAQAYLSSRWEGR